MLCFDPLTSYRAELLNPIRLADSAAAKRTLEGASVTPAKMVSSISKQTTPLAVSHAIVTSVALNVMTSLVTSLMDAVTAREMFEVIELRHKSCTLSGI